MKTGKRKLFAAILTVALICGSLSACTGRAQDPTKTPSKEPSPTASTAPSPDATDAPEPTNTKAPTETPTPTAAETPTPTATEAPTPTEEPTPTEAPAVGTTTEYYDGWWYATYVEGADGPIDFKTDDTVDYRLFFEDGYLIQTRTFTHYLREEGASAAYFVPRTEFSEEEKAMYESWNYGLSEVIKTPTDYSKGHLLFKSAEEFDEGALLSVDAQADGTLKVEYMYVMDNGSFPIFCSYVFSRERPYPVGTYYEDYVNPPFAAESDTPATWYAQSFASWLGEALIPSKEEPFDMRLTFDAAGELEAAFFYEDSQTPVYEKYQLRTGFTEEETEEYRKWDKAGGRSFETHWEGWAGDIAACPYRVADGRMVFTRTDQDEAVADMLAVEWDDENEMLRVYTFSFDKETNEEVIMYYTFGVTKPY